MISGVAPAAVDTFGVNVERAAGIDEHQHRRAAAMRGGESVGRAHRVARAQPVGGSVELSPQSSSQPAAGAADC